MQEPFYFRSTVHEQLEKYVTKCIAEVTQPFLIVIRAMKFNLSEPAGVSGQRFCVCSSIIS